MLNPGFIFSNSIIYTIAIFSTIWFLYQKSHSQRVESLPPGPKPLPILGNAHQIPTKNIQEVYREWKKLYDLDNDTLANHLPVRAGLDTTWVLSPYGDTIRHFRKLGRHIMGSQAIGKYESVQEDEARSFVKALIDCPDELLSHVDRILYGYSPSPELDAISKAGQRITYEASALLTASSRLTWQWGIIPPRTPYVLHCYSKSKNTSVLISRPAGQETTSATLYMFFFMMGNNPGIQAKARAEIMSITGGHRLPQLSDRTSFVYVMAVFKEVLRYHSAAPLGLPHLSDEEYTYEGYRIPKNTIVFGNIWEILHDPEIYPDPFEFKPERFLDIPTKTPDGYPTDPRQYVFGFGRRTCPASHLAESTLLISIATVLATCDIGPCFNPDGSKIEKFQYTPTLVAHPLPFTCSINPIAREIL
ncbi:hypothetical protein Clacol_009703 [Clathrus columnatus]|uniref:Cytochrome P450 n=1 Tax=Clathrus columnatus TaxID=1419009 RepID=A0AAV5ASW0_9AGAM|nr:hypothetical protein Clacol_009703 [Clathrus columnatus]